MSKAKILYYDLETAPILAAVWGLWEQNAVWVESEWYILCFAYRWEGEKKTHVISLPDYKRYKKSPEDDYDVVKKLWALFNEADVLIAHNGDKFDQRKSNARFIYHGLTPPSFYKSVDTLKVARKNFAFDSNRLDSLGEHLKVGRKIKTDKDLWQGCLRGDLKAWKKMKLYNKQDVELLRDVYLKLRPWIANHPSLSVIADDPTACPKCGGHQLVRNGMKYTKTGKTQQWLCKECGGYAFSRGGEKIEKPLLVN